MKKLSIVASLAIAGALSLSIVGCGSSSGSTATIGKVADGYVTGATVCIDDNNDSKCDPKEPKAITDENGAFTFKNSELNASANILAIGGSDIATGEVLNPNDPLMLPAGVRQYIVTPVTTMIAKVVKNGVKLDEATKKVAAYLGVKDTNVLFQDPAASFNEATKATLLAQVVKNSFDPKTIATEENVTSPDVVKNYAKIIESIPEDTNPVVAEQAFKAVADANATDINISSVITLINNVHKEAKDDNKTVSADTLIKQVTEKVKDATNSGGNNVDTNASNIINNVIAYELEYITFGKIKASYDNGSFGTIKVNVDDNTSYADFSDISIKLKDDSLKDRSGSYDMDTAIKIVDKKDSSNSLEIKLTGAKVEVSDGAVTSKLDGSKVTVINNGLSAIKDISSDNGTVTASISGISDNTDLGFNLSTIINSLSTNQTKLQSVLDDLNSYLRQTRSYTVVITLKTDMPLPSKVVVGTVDVTNATAKADNSTSGDDKGSAENNTDNGGDQGTSGDDVDNNSSSGGDQGSAGNDTDNGGDQGTTGDDTNDNGGDQGTSGDDV